MYINRLDYQTRDVETVDEATGKEARRLVREYQMSDPSASYYLSTKPTNCYK